MTTPDRTTLALAKVLHARLDLCNLLVELVDGLFDMRNIIGKLALSAMVSE